MGLFSKKPVDIMAQANRAQEGIVDLAESIAGSGAGGGAGAAGAKGDKGDKGDAGAAGTDGTDGTIITPATRPANAAGTKVTPAEYDALIAALVTAGVFS